MKYMKILRISTKGHNDIIDITLKVKEAVEESGVKEGICLISCPGSTCGITTMEYEEGLIEDLKKTLDKIAPVSSDYLHCQKWGDCNGYAHIRSAIIQPFLAVPIENGSLALGTWQQIVFIDFDNRARIREIYITIVSS
ncbi:YjbQ family protein [bacterium]|nr:YjbQ family protein [bacterium]